ncbi:hypothetical protein HMPREF1136_0835 [Actinomyces sp. ICM47]|nr:hypothetical protein HMPREF1136_0835 [Actinomyces sp. ICM47]
MSPILAPNSCVEIGTFFPWPLTRPWLAHAIYLAARVRRGAVSQHFHTIWRLCTQAKLVEARDPRQPPPSHSACA